jgi:hypothetical protein
VRPPYGVCDTPIPPIQDYTGAREIGVVIGGESRGRRKQGAADTADPGVPGGFRAIFSRPDPHDFATIVSTFSGGAYPGNHLRRYLFRVT